MPDQWVTKLSFQHIQHFLNEKGVLRTKEEKSRLPVDLRGSKTSVLKLPIDRLNTSASLYRIAPCLRNRKHVPCFYRVIQARVEVWENEKCCGNTSRRWVFPQLFRVLPNFHECLYNSIDTRSTCFLFRFRKQRDEKEENNLLTLIIKM